jgi:hypothetical protein
VTTGHSQSSLYVEGELVDITVRARYAEQRASQHVFVADAGDEPYELAFPPAAQVRVKRVAPGEWPPQAGDIWADRDSCEWIGRVEVVDGEAYPTLTLIDITSGRANVSTADGVVDAFGPLRLVRRRNWTVGPANVRPESESDVDQRAALIAGARELLDFVEAHPELPFKEHTFDVQVFVKNLPDITREADAFAELVRIADILGVEPNLEDSPGLPHPHASKRFSGGVTYEAVYVTEAYRREYKPVEPEAAEDPGSDELAEVAEEFGVTILESSPGPARSEELPHRVPTGERRDGAR